MHQRAGGIELETLQWTWKSPMALGLGIFLPAVIGWVTDAFLWASRRDHKFLAGSTEYRPQTHSGCGRQNSAPLRSKANTEAPGGPQPGNQSAGERRGRHTAYIEPGERVGESIRESPVDAAEDNRGG
jgi:hypothetical protein